MDRLLTMDAAIKYLRERAGSMSYKTFMAEINAGRLPYKPYGTKMRFRRQDLDTWLHTTETHHSDYTNVATRGTHISRASLVGTEWSYAKLLEQQRGIKRHSGQSTASAKS